MGSIPLQRDLKQLFNVEFSCLVSEFSWMITIDRFKASIMTIKMINKRKDTLINLEGFMG